MPFPINNDFKGTLSVSELSMQSELIPLPDLLDGKSEQNVSFETKIKGDPSVKTLLEKGEGPYFQNGYFQSEEFNANVKVGAGRNWDMHTAEGMLDTAQKSVSAFKEMVSGKAKYAEYDQAIGVSIAKACNAHSGPLTAELAQSYMEFKQLVKELTNARSSLLEGLSDGTGCPPRDGLDSILKSQRVFRYEMQVHLASLGCKVGSMETTEKLCRSIQNKFTFGITAHVDPKTLIKIQTLENSLLDKVSEIRNRLRELDRAAMPPAIPKGFKFEEGIGEALELSHRTNDQIRDFQERDSTTAWLRDMITPIAEKGGSHEVKLTVGVDGLLGLGFPGEVTAGFSVGARVKVIGKIACDGKGSPINVTFRIGGGVEALGEIAVKKPSANPVEEDKTIAQAKLKGGADISHFTKRSYPTVNDFILDSDRCKFATSRPMLAAIGSGISTAFSKTIGKLGKRFFGWLSRRSDDVKQNNAQYFQSIKERGIASSVDKLLNKKSNAVYTSETSGWVIGTDLQGSANFSFGDIVDLGVGGSASVEKEYRVTSESLSHVATIAYGAKDTSELEALMLPGPQGGDTPPIPRIDTVEDFDALYEAALDEAKEVEKESAKWYKPGVKKASIVSFAQSANKLRTIMLAVELAAREGRLTRSAANQLLVRYSEPPVKFPPDIFREYFLVGTGVAKPAKIRSSVTAEVKTKFLPGLADKLTGNIANPTAIAAASGAIKTMQSEVGLDSTYQYRFSSEKPANPGADKRPWENAVKTTHEMAVSGSIPARVIIDAITRSYINRGERIENKSQHLVKDVAKDVTGEVVNDTVEKAVSNIVPGVVLANIDKAVLGKIVAWFQSNEVVQFLNPTNFDMTVEHMKTIKWSFVNGEFESLSISNEDLDKVELSLNPLKVGVDVNVSYSVTDSIKQRNCNPHPPLLSLLAKCEEFLFGESGLKPAGNGEFFKLWLSRNAHGVEQTLKRMMSDKNLEKTVQIYADAQVSAASNPKLLDRLQKSWHTLQALADDATLDVKMDAMHEFLTATVIAFRTEEAA